MKKIHLICNAHLDPIWQWIWDEGISATIATFKSAADLAEKYDYIFCHNEALLYEAIEKNVPKLFKQIQNLVRRGKWKISGGWYLQPDCNLPCGESFVRQIKVGQKYFQEKFGLIPTVATNYDSFGHSIGLVQILKKCGYKGYMICRPNEKQFDYPGKFFNWISPDGSSILVTRSDSYSSPLGNAAKKIMKEAENAENIDYVLWGVGNHGGGPSIKDLNDISLLKIDNTKILHSMPENLFADNVKNSGEIRSSLVTCMPGCYSSMTRIKQAYRVTENDFYATEKILAIAELAGYKFDISNYEIAQKNLLLAQFHDVLPGTCTSEGENEGFELLAASHKIIKDYRTGAFLYLVMEEEIAAKGEYPVFVFNYMPYEVKTPVEVEFVLSDQNRGEEEYIPEVRFGDEIISCQLIKESSTINIDWRKRIVFEAILKPLSITRFSVTLENQRYRDKIKKPVAALETDLTNKLTIDKIALEMYDDSADPWAMNDDELKCVGRNPKEFRLMSIKEATEFCKTSEDMPPIHITEQGTLLTAIEAFYTEENTNAVIEYRFYKNFPFTDIKVTLEYFEKNKLIRLRIPAPQGITVGDGPYVIEEKQKGEITFRDWIGIRKDDNDVFAVINNGIYAGKVESGFIYLTLLRGAGYCFHPIDGRELYPQNRYLPRIESGRYVFQFRIFSGNIDDVCCEAALFNQLPYAVNIFPIGGTKKNSIYIETDKKVLMPVCKITEQGNIVMRFQNPSDKKSTFILHVNKEKTVVCMDKYAVVSVIYMKGVFDIKYDEMPLYC
jgi:alpha-mannosidase